jgi:transglutaminase-like putative cysteine protease
VGRVVLCRVGCEFVYQVQAATPAVAQVFVRPDGPHVIRAERTELLPNARLTEYIDTFGNRCGRLVMPEGRVSLRYDAIVEVSDAPDEVAPEAPQTTVENLPNEALQFVLPSRYCPSDRLLSVAWDLFGGTEPGWPRVQAICDWVHTSVSFMHGSVGLADALEVYLQRRGVCRDFAHLAVTFCRAMNIPARYGFGYLGDIGIPPMDSAMDFHAWFEVFLGGRWYTFDCRHNTPRIGRIFIGKGRDATDVAMLTTFGSPYLERMTVWADEVAKDTTLDG